MKKIKLVLSAAALILTAAMLGSCGGTDKVSGKEGMEKYVQEYYSNDHLVLTKSESDNSEVLTWFASDNAMLRQYIAATFRVASDGKFEFVRMENVEKVTDKIMQCIWHDGVSFYIDDSRCVKLSVKSDDGSIGSDIGEAPSSVFFRFKPGETGLDISFLDKNGKKIR